jgi:hypothetical protein
MADSAECVSTRTREQIGYVAFRRWTTFRLATKPVGGVDR